MSPGLVFMDFISDINKDYAAVMNYDRVDRFVVNILWWHFAALALLTFTNSVLQAALYYPSPFSWRLISGPEALGTIVVGLAVALMPTWVRSKLDHHYLWRVFISVALTTYSYLFVFVSGGSIEMHFHFFMIMALLVIYADWRLEWIVLILTALHHGLLNYIQPEWVYFYGRNDISVIAHALPVLTTAIFTSLLCQNHRNTVERLSHLTESLTFTNEKLEQANRELQDFAYVASHDLQEPLRKIQAFGDRLRTKFGPTLGEEGSDYLARMQNAAGRMQSLINDLLNYTRVTRITQPQIAVNLTETAREVVSDLEARLVQTGGHVDLGLLPTVNADPLQMRQLLQNLIGNALKFHRPEVVPLVKVYATSCQDPTSATRSPGAERDGEVTSPAWQIVVEDNGIGFDEKYLDRIFKPFQRLHGRNEYEGTGMGLAICYKIVARHKGSLTAKSALGQGTTFIVTLPQYSKGENIL
jgi:signal transduction histidine kinase